MLMLGDFNVDIDEPPMKFFCKTYNLPNQIKQPTCYKIPDNSTCIDPKQRSAYISKYLCS